MTSNKKLLIVNSNQDIKLKKYEDNYDYYSLSSGLVKDFNAKNLNSPKKFHLIALSLKKKYLSFIEEFEKYFNQNKIAPHFNHYYLTDISCKRTEYLRNFDYICHIVILKALVEEKKYDEIILYNISPEIIYSLKKFIHCKINILKKYRTSKYQLITTLITQFNYLIKMLILKILLKIFYVPNKSIYNLQNLYFTTYPKNFKNNTHIKYGKFNVGWISFSRDDQGLECLSNWYKDCIDWCFQKVEPNRYADQKYLDKWPINYKNLKIIKHKGANLAPWNIANYNITKTNNSIYIDQDKLIFFHFANIKQISAFTFKTNLSRVLVRTSGIIKDDIYTPYLRSLSEILKKLNLKILSKNDINHKSFFINILVKLYRGVRDLIYNDIIELQNE